MEQADIIWAAGFFDGEGCVLIHERGPFIRKGKYRVGGYRILIVTVAQVDPAPLEKLRALFGGNIGLQRAKLPGRADRYNWRASARTAGNALRQLVPYLVNKRAVAELGLGFQALKGTNGPTRWPLSSARKAKEKWYADAIRWLNRRGVPRGDVVLPPRPVSPQMVMKL